MSKTEKEQLKKEAPIELKDQIECEGVITFDPIQIRIPKNATPEEKQRLIAEASKKMIENARFDPDGLK